MVVCAIVEDEREVFFRDASEVKAVAAAIKASTSTKFGDEVGKGSKLPVGSRVLFDGEDEDVVRRRKAVLKSVRALGKSDSIFVKLRPLRTCRAPPPSVRATTQQEAATVSCPLK